MKALKKEGWKISTVWDGALKPAKVEKTLAFILNIIYK